MEAENKFVYWPIGVTIFENDGYASEVYFHEAIN